MRQIKLIIVCMILAFNSWSQETELPQVIQDFLYSDGENPVGKISERAPKELEQFGQFVGVWEMTSHAEHQGKWYSGWPSIWAWKYDLSGTVILDYFYHEKENFPPIVPKDFDTHGMNLRAYDAETNIWTMVWATNRQTVNLYKAEWQGAEMWIVPMEENPKNEMKIIFYDITKDSFKWRVETPDENGKWTYSNYLVAKRIL